MKDIIHKNESRIFLVLFITYAFFAHWGGWNENASFNLVRSIVEEQTFNLDRLYNNTSDRAYFEGHYYSAKAPGMAFIAAPAYAGYHGLYGIFKNPVEEAGGNISITRIGKNSKEIVDDVDPGFFLSSAMLILTALTSSLFTALSAALVYRIVLSHGFTEKNALICAFIFGAATISAHYAMVFLTHATGTFFILLNYHLLQKKGLTAKTAIGAGMAGGYAVVSEHVTAIILAVNILAFSILKGKKTAYVLTGVIIGLSPLLIYNSIIFHNPLDFAVRYMDEEIFDIDSFERQNLGFARAKPDAMIALRMLFYPYRGLFFYSPILLLALPGLLQMWRDDRRRHALSIIGVFLAFTLLFSTRTKTWYGGYCFGLRYMVPIIPFLVIPIAYTFKKYGVRPIVVLATLSILINLLGLQVMEDRILDPRTVYISEFYLEVQNTPEVLYNPIIEHYLPKSLEHGPRSRLFESVVYEGKIDIRDRGKPPADYKPFSSILPLIVALGLAVGLTRPK